MTVFHAFIISVTTCGKKLFPQSSPLLSPHHTRSFMIHRIYLLDLHLTHSLRPFSSPQLFGNLIWIVWCLSFLSSVSSSSSDVCFYRFSSSSWILSLQKQKTTKNRIHKGSIQTHFTFSSQQETSTYSYSQQDCDSSLAKPSRQWVASCSVCWWRRKPYWKASRNMITLLLWFIHVEGDRDTRSHFYLVGMLEQKGNRTLSSDMSRRGN